MQNRCRKYYRTREEGANHCPGEGGGGVGRIQEDRKAVFKYD